MRIGIDALLMYGQYAGIAYSIDRTIRAFAGLASGDSLVAYVPRDHSSADLEGPSVKLRRLWFPGRWKTIRILWEHLRLVSHLYKDEVDLLHGIGYVVPVNCPKPAVATIHDIAPLTHPALCRRATVAHFKSALPRTARLARRIAVPTRAVADGVREKLGVPDDRMDVIPWGVDDSFGVISDRRRLDEARATWNLPEKYILFVGNQEPKKNLQRLVEAFFAARAHKRLPHKLLLVGQYGWNCRDLFRLVRDLNARDYILFTGYIPREALPFLYNLADLFLFPSVVEGFGMPVLEAMACGCPAVISKDAALREVAGGAAREVPHDSLPALREAIEALAADCAERRELREKGLRRAKQFTWRRTAELTLECYRKALE